MELKSQHSNKLGYGYFSNSTYYQNYYYHQGQISYYGDLLSSLYILPIIELSYKLINSNKGKSII